MVFLFTSIAVFNTIAFFMPKRISGKEIYASCVFALIYEHLADYTFGLIYHLYGYFGGSTPHTPTILAVAVIVGIYPAINVIFLNYYPFGRTIRVHLLYILGWSVFSTLFEWASTRAGFLIHTGWHLWFSAISYPLILVVTVLNFLIIRTLNEMEKRT